MKLYDSRWQFIEDHVTGKEVLDLGVAELAGTVNEHKKARWIHGLIQGSARRVVALEQNREQVEALRAKGYSVAEGDAQDFALGERFEVVVAGELIEHLSNPGAFLDCARRHLVPGGKLLLTTPNRFSVLTALKVLRSGRVPRYTKPIPAKHVLYFDSDALESLLTRHGFGEVAIGYCKWVGAPSDSRWLRWIVRWMAWLRPVTMSTLVAVARAPD